MGGGGLPVTWKPGNHGLKGDTSTGLFNTRAVRGLCTFRNKKKGNLSEKGLG